jgi:saccharopine dehydrogenase (NADP+, L-glutamate forming)
MARVHWLGAGLSSGPGIRRVAQSGQPMTLWNRTVAKAKEVLRGGAAHVDVKPYDLAALGGALSPQDVVVSMLPAPMHPEIAQRCLERGAHLVTTSYISDAMRALDAPAKARGLSLLNECGLDPGLDHMLAHKLVAELRDEDLSGARVSFYSYCGGIPAVPGPFTYKFSWSPVGVLRALKNTARCLEDGREVTTGKPWTVAKPWRVLGEEFEVYPNRDSLPYIREYHFDEAWQLGDFVRGTIRARGWREAWRDVFQRIDTASEAELQALSDELWQRHQYAEGEADRVVLVVRLVAHKNGAPVFSRGYVLDERGTADRTAMGALVSLPAAFAVQDVLDGKVAAGVSAAPRDAGTIDAWLRSLRDEGLRVRVES